MAYFQPAKKLKKNHRKIHQNKNKKKLKKNSKIAINFN